MTQKKQSLIEQYKQHLLFEKVLSTNTLDAYIRDVEKLIVYLDKEGIDPLAAELGDLENFLAHLHDKKISARSQARILSGIRSDPLYNVSRELRVCQTARTDGMTGR